MEFIILTMRFYVFNKQQSCFDKRNNLIVGTVIFFQA